MYEYVSECLSKPKTSVANAEQYTLLLFLFFASVFLPKHNAILHFWKRLKSTTHNSMLFRMIVFGRKRAENVRVSKNVVLDILAVFARRVYSKKVNHTI